MSDDDRLPGLLMRQTLISPAEGKAIRDALEILKQIAEERGRYRSADHRYAISRLDELHRRYLRTAFVQDWTRPPDQPLH